MTNKHICIGCKGGLTDIDPNCPYAYCNCAKKKRKRGPRKKFSYVNWRKDGFSKGYVLNMQEKVID